MEVVHDDEELIMTSIILGMVGEDVKANKLLQVEVDGDDDASVN